MARDLGPWLLPGKTHLLLMAESNTHGIFVAPRTRVPSLLFPTPAEKGNTDTGSEHLQGSIRTGREGPRGLYLELELFLYHLQRGPN